MGAPETAAVLETTPARLDTAAVSGGGGRFEGKGGGNSDLEGFRQRVDTIVSKVDDLEMRVNEVTVFYTHKKQQSQGPTAAPLPVVTKVGSGAVAKVKEKVEAACTKRMQELIRQFGTIMRQITLHKWSWPFMQPVDVEGLGLHDYYEIIKKPMDFSTIKNLMEAKDGTGYKNVREIYADVRLVFTNAMTYNDERNDIHVMAKTLLSKVEEKWLQLLPKVIEEETRQKEEEAHAQAEMQIAQEAAIAKLANDMSIEINDLGLHLEELRETVVSKCRKLSTEEKRKIANDFGKLPTEDIEKALEIISRHNPSFAAPQTLNIDIDAQNESTLWRLKFFIESALELQAKNSASKKQENKQRKREICDALAKTAKKRNKRLST